jgi:UDP-glucose 4-epimerase
MKIVVTGGAGFIASHIVDAYIKRGHELFVIDDLSTGQRRNLNPNAKFYPLDIADTQAAKLIEEIKPDVLNHHAAQGLAVGGGERADPDSHLPPLRRIWR